METVALVDGSSASDTSSVRKTKASPPVSQLVRLLWGEDTAELQMSIGHIPHIVMYLSLKLDSASPQEEVSFLSFLTQKMTNNTTDLDENKDFSLNFKPHLCYFNQKS